MSTPGKQTEREQIKADWFAALRVRNPSSTLKEERVRLVFAKSQLTRIEIRPRIGVRMDGG